MTGVDDVGSPVESRSQTVYATPESVSSDSRRSGKTFLGVESTRIGQSEGRISGTVVVVGTLEEIGGPRNIQWHLGRDTTCGRDLSW